MNRANGAGRSTVVVELAIAVITFLYLHGYFNEKPPKRGAAI
jgi:hypothetical protein